MSESTPPTDATMAYQPEPPAPPTMAGEKAPLSYPVASTGVDDSAVAGYEILSELGRGGMGVVYKARQIALNRIVALKMILSGKFAGDTQLARFQAEAEALAKVQHPNIVQVYDVGSHHGNAYIALECVEGGDLAGKLRSLPQPPRAAARLIEILARAMQVAHEAGIVHRDLKPVNILLQPFILGDTRNLGPGSSQRSLSKSSKSLHSKSSLKQSIMTHVSVEYGTPKITDFGLAKQEEGAASSGLTNAGSIMGTPSYMSPEQAIGDIGLIGPATDIYALGAILYEMLTGRPPFRADTPVNTIMQVIRGEVVAPSKLIAKLPRDLETITLKCLEKSTTKRYGTAQELADDLENYLEDRPITARPAGRIERSVKWVRRHPLIAGFIFVTLTGILSFISLGIFAYLAVNERALAAEVANERALASARESKQRLIRLAVANGNELIDRKEFLGGAGWFAEALKLDENNPVSEISHRKRLAAVLARSPILGHLWLHEAAINDVKISLDGNLLASGGNDGLVRLWNLKDGKPAHIPLEHGSIIANLEFSPDRQELIVLSADGVCKLWKWGSQVEQRVLGQGLAIARFAPDGKTIITVGKAGGLVVYRVTNFESLTTMLANNGFVSEIALSPDGKWALAPSRDGFVRLWDLGKADLHVPPMKQGSPAVCVAIHPGGAIGASGGDDGRVWLWNLHTGELALPNPIKHDGAITSIDFSADGQTFVTSSEDREVVVWEVATGRQFSPRLRHGSRVVKARFSPDGRWVGTLSEDNFARIFETRKGQLVISPFRHNGTPLAFQFTPNGRGLITGGQDHLLRHWILPVQLDESIEMTVFKSAAQSILSTQSRQLTSPDGKLAANYGGNQSVRIRDAITREPLSPALKTGGNTSTAVFSNDSQWLATGGFEGEVQVWSSKTGEPAWLRAGQHTSRVYVMAFHPNGEVLATGSDDNTIRFWNARTGEALFAPIRHDGGVYWLKFSQDGATIFSASLDGTTRVWDSSTGEPITPRLPAWNGTDWKDELPTTPMPVNEILTLTQALTGMEVDKLGGMTLLDSKTVKERFSQVEGRSEQTFIPTDDVTWHEYHARTTEKSGQWFAAAWHLQRLTEIESKSTEYRQRLAHAWGELGAWTKVKDISTQLLQTSPALVEGWQQRGRAYGELKQWREAMRDISTAALLQHQPAWREVMPALMKLDQGDIPGYEKECLALMQKASLEPASRIVVGSVAMLRPISGTPYAEWLTWAEQNYKTQPENKTLQLLHAALLVRSGQAEAAVARLQALSNTDDNELLRTLWLALAEPGQSALLKNKVLNLKQQAETQVTSWPEHVQRRVLLAEVEKKWK